MQLDDLWTEGVSLYRILPSNEVPDFWASQLQALAHEIERILTELAASAGPFGEVARNNANEAQEALRSLMWGDLLDAPSRDDLRWWVGQRTFASLIEQALATLSEQSITTEVEHLREQVSLLSNGDDITGDLSKGFRCGTASGILAGGVLLIPTGVGAGMAALGVGTLAVAAGFGTGGVGLLLAGTALWWARRVRC
jgi:hypothetical protein